MSTGSSTAPSRWVGYQRVICVTLLGSSLGACINKGDTNIGRDETKPRTTEAEEDSGVSSPSSGTDEADDDTATEDDDPAAGDDDDSPAAPEPSPDEPETPASPAGSGGSANAEGGVSGNGSEPGMNEDVDASAGESPEPDIDDACAGQDIPLTVAAGAYSTCGVTKDGSVKCWGGNAFGQLGTGDFEGSAIPVSVRGLCARQVVVGSDHACAIGLDGGVRCWGYNEYGQLGDGRNSNRALPSDVELDGAQQLSAGGAHTCALTDDGVYCWGYNGYGQLGDTSIVDSNVPVRVEGLGGDTVLQIETGGSHTCAVLDGGAVKCWGNGGSGQLGNQMITNSAVVPLDVLELTDATQISAGRDHTCARLEGSAVACWGVIPQGPSFNDGFVGQVPSVSAASVESGYTFTCTLNSNGGVSCWGLNDRGQIGVGSLMRPSYDTPQEVGGDTEGATALTLGDEHACVVLPDDVVKCWGRGDSGQLGTGSASDSTTPVELQLFP